MTRRRLSIYDRSQSVAGMTKYWRNQIDFYKYSIEHLLSLGHFISHKGARISRKSNVFLYLLKVSRVSLPENYKQNPFSFSSIQEKSDERWKSHGLDAIIVFSLLGAATKLSTANVSPEVIHYDMLGMLPRGGKPSKGQARKYTTKT